jgi:3-methyladenine DNA glycosylase AlkD
MSPLAQRIRQELEKHGDPIRAPQMQKYVKSAMPCYGISVPLLRQTCKRVFRDVTFANADAWRRGVLELWREAKHREERYAAIELTGIRAAAN